MDIARGYDAYSDVRALLLMSPNHTVEVREADGLGYSFRGSVRRFIIPGA